MATGGGENITDILEKICSIFSRDCPENKEYIQTIAARHLLEGLSNQITPSSEDVSIVEDNVQKQVEKLNSSTEGLVFRTLAVKLKKLNYIKNTSAALKFLLLQSLEKNSAPQSAMDKISKIIDPRLERIFPSESKSSYCSVESSSKKTFSSSSVSANSRNQLCLKQFESDRRSIRTSFANSAQFNDEHDLIQEVIFALQGIEGKILRLEPSGGFRVDPKADINQSQKRIILRLSEVGFLHNKIKEFCDNVEKKFGLMYQSITSAFREELTSYYKLIAILQEQLNSDSKLSLRRLLVWVMEPQQRLQWLVSVGHAVQFKKGGDLISAIYAFVSHGDPSVQKLIQSLLSEVCRPLLNSISQWVLDGHIEDPFAEFFIEARPDVTGDRLWHEKYRLRESMIPAFITRNQAEKILAVGKSIVFLREVCKEAPPVIAPGIKKLFDAENVDLLYVGNSSVIHSAIESVYKNTSRKVLDILLNKYSLIPHLHAIKRYLLLGQGDFIRHLMELLMPELSLPASKITIHNLSSILESAVRSTNAQFEDPDVLARLDVKTVQNSEQDIGWDVFLLVYHTNGPIGTIFNPSEEQYMALFHSMWSSKRMEFILSALWKNLTTSARAFRHLQGVPAVMQLMHLLTAEMIHLVRQMQYYILFEILESNWEELTKRLESAVSLDDVISAHNHFLEAVTIGALLDKSAEDLGRQLRNIYSHVTHLQACQERLCSQAQAELDAQQLEQLEMNRENGGFATNTKIEALKRERKDRFQTELNVARGSLKTLKLSYRNHVKKFLAMLADQPDVKLQSLSFRLDFNGHYKRLHRK